MKALSIVALVFSGVSILVPVFGVFIAMFCSVLALITFCKHPTLSGVTFGLNIISTAFLSPTLVISAASQGDSGAGTYLFYVGFHVVLMLIAFVIFFVSKKKQKAA
ncbi:hypothetical protein [uncultured Gilliamella sp.]|uniref:hypothetical protein n=1 Tax=uncultured Gilliamella sp. TaxID=1193505 RepID=UPI0025F523D7|nr:hypothetical protein [uncultured Gilliamella sp.]